jgi:hypothetical protein
MGGGRTLRWGRISPLRWLLLLRLLLLRLWLLLRFWLLLLR